MTDVEGETPDFEHVDLLDEKSTPLESPPEAAAAEAATEMEPAQEQAEEKPKKPGLLTRLTEASPYTVMLAISLLAILIGVLCLLLEWNRYSFDTKARAAKQSAARAPAAELPVCRVMDQVWLQATDGWA